MNVSDHDRLLAVAEKWQRLYENAREEVERLRMKLRDEMQTTATLEMQDLDEFKSLRAELVAVRAEAERLRSALQEIRRMHSGSKYAEVNDSHCGWCGTIGKSCRTFEIVAAAAGTGPTGDPK